MKREVLIGMAVAGLLALAAAGAVWNEYLRKPPPESLALPAGLIPLNSPQGRRLLAESASRADYDELIASFVPQTRKAYCGVASAITVLNAAGIERAPGNPRAVFAPTDVSLNPLKASFTGMSLRGMADLLRAHGARVEVFPASTTDVASFRRLARANLGQEDDYLLVNYQRTHLGQARMGHISPLAAYHAPSDRLLILDVAAHKYPPVWADLDQVWQAMRAPLNARTTTTRGFIVVHGVDTGAVASTAPP